MIAVVDYGMGNLRSVQKAFEYLGFDARITSQKQEMKDASHIVLPGVGAFGDAICCLEKTGVCETIGAEISKGKPFLGICLGMQLLFEKSLENGLHGGLGLVSCIRTMRQMCPMNTSSLKRITAAALWPLCKRTMYSVCSSIPRKAGISGLTCCGVLED
jgi:imidazole glycerol phosphate synthase glutamine amidotransferase subunit